MSLVALEIQQIVCLSLNIAEMVEGPISGRDEWGFIVLQIESYLDLTFHGAWNSKFYCYSLITDARSRKRIF